MRLIEDPAFRAKDRELRQIYLRWDHSTALRCLQRGVEFDPILERVFWDQWLTAITSVYEPKEVKNGP